MSATPEDVQAKIEQAQTLLTEASTEVGQLVAPPTPAPDPPPVTSGLWAWDVQALQEHPDSAAWVKSLIASTPAGFVSASVAVATRHADTATYERHGTANDGLDANFWVPAGTKPGLSNDHHLSILDTVTGRTQDMHRASVGSDGKIDSWGGGMRYPNTLATPYVPQITGRKNASTNASNVPALPSALTPEDVAAGVAARTLRFPFNLPGPGKPLYPAAPYAVAYKGGTAANPPLGVTVRLPASATLSTSAGPLERCIFETLKRHGAVGTDGGSDLTFKAADAGGGGQSANAWAAVGVTLNTSAGGLLASKGRAARLTLIPWHLLQVVVLPAT